MTATRRTAASGTEILYHWLRNPTMLVHEGSGSASSGPVVALLHSDAWMTTSWNTDSDVQLGATACALLGWSFSGARLGGSGRHQAGARDRKQSHERDGDASGHV